MATALVLLAEGFEELEAVTIIDVLRRGEVKVTTASLVGKHVKGSHDIVLEADTLLDLVSVADFDALVLPGGPAAKTLREDARVQSTIQRAAHEGKLLAAVCAAPTALEAAGVLSGGAGHRVPVLVSWAAYAGLWCIRPAAPAAP